MVTWCELFPAPGLGGTWEGQCFEVEPEGELRVASCELPPGCKVPSVPGCVQTPTVTVISLLLFLLHLLHLLSKLTACCSTTAITTPPPSPSHLILPSSLSITPGVPQIPTSLIHDCFLVRSLLRPAYLVALPPQPTRRPFRHRLTQVALSPVMATSHPQSGPVGPDTLITVKIIIDGTNRRFKLPLRDLGANVLPQKVTCFPSA